ncbi:YfaZ family outer membrane protein [Marinomonas algarum]|uniref:YfaZ family protein n=1 Tax=Marinomonas algarum TaxID=2883105 RepID=A0A9X1IJ90_9GAMM|nr:YfaZ family outer membrane protein [Marinomonas algarum]MCB5160323.1 YfaZ family protein [Marinomonas algarum]
MNSFTCKALLMAAGILGSSVVAASSAGVSLTNETVKGDLNVNMGSFGLNVGLSRDDDTDSTTGYVGATIEDSDTSGPLQAGLGIRLNAIDNNRPNDNDLSLAVSLGGWYRYTLQKANRVSIYGSLYYAPEVLSFNDLDHTYNYEFRLEYMTMRNARAYVSYGETVTIYNDGSRKEINDGVAFGANVIF